LPAHALKKRLATSSGCQKKQKIEPVCGELAEYSQGEMCRSLSFASKLIFFQFTFTLNTSFFQHLAVTVSY
jgi:hypothetical protein